jgi:hypothetical protein
MMKIPKRIIQLSKIEFSNKYKNKLLELNNDWEYNYFDNNSMQNYIINNPIQELTNAINVYNNFIEEKNKYDFFKYYYLYLNGGIYIDYDIILKTSLTSLLINVTFFCCKSMFKNNCMFNGFIGCEPKNYLIYEALKHLYHIDNRILSGDIFYNDTYLYSIINNYENIVKSFFINPEEILSLKCKIFYERGIVMDNKNETHIYYNYELSNKKNYSYTEIFDNNKNAILERYFGNKYLLIKSIVNSNVEKKDINKTKIGVWLKLPKSSLDFFYDIKIQSLIYLSELLLNIGYDVIFIFNEEKYDDKVIEELLYDSRFKSVKYDKILKENFDIIISTGYENVMEKYMLCLLKLMNTKNILFNCGDNYASDFQKCSMSNSLQLPRNTYITKNEYSPYDIIWSHPQDKNNKHYLSVLFRVNSIDVPFVWSNNSINIHKKTTQLNKNFSHIKRDKSKKIAIFEENTCLSKWSIPSLLLCENYYRNNSAKINQVYITNIVDTNVNANVNANANANDMKEKHIQSKFNVHEFNIFLNNLNLCKDNKVSIEDKYDVLAFMNIYGDIVVSSQNENINYFYLELAWVGWPIIHNSYFLKDIGYYYEGFNYEEGGKLLDNVIDNHDNNVNEYIENNKKVIDKYLTTNEELKNKYIELINNLYK